MDPNQLLQGGPGRSRETTIKRDAQGRWFFDGESLEHPGLTRAFDRWIERAEDGRYCLKNEINWAYFTLEGPPFFVRSLTKQPDGGIELLLSNDARERLQPATLRSDAQGALYCDTQSAMVARFDSHAAMQLEPLIGEDERGMYVQLEGRQVRPPVVDDPLQPSPASKG